jgi:hypothetical protein
MTTFRLGASPTLDWRQLASIIACRKYEIVGGQVTMLDPDGSVLLSGARDALNTSMPSDATRSEDAVRAPLRFRGHTIEVAVPADVRNGAPLPESVVHSIVDLVFKQAVIGFFELPADTICAWDNLREVAILKASDSKNLETLDQP